MDLALAVIGALILGLCAAATWVIVKLASISLRSRFARRRDEGDRRIESDDTFRG